MKSRRNEKITLADLPPRIRREVAGLPPVEETKPKRHKYGVGKKEDRTCDGIVFASIREMKRYGELRAMQQAGVIRDLELQPKWDLHVNGVKVGTYSADFLYDETGEIVVEDVKSKPTMTTTYRLKKRMLRAEYGIEIRET